MKKANMFTYQQELKSAHAHSYNVVCIKRRSLLFSAWLTRVRALAVQDKPSLSGSVMHGLVADILVCPSWRSRPQTSATHATLGSPPAESHRFSATCASVTSQHFTELH
ncbi:hypothetical protein AMECASPLE_001204 [Ameca splendens]|uniref:Uncharacterized protein n=1 Tax=Ameca splendens TaxID=208324 RepID=A0ABV0XYD6_9TELE